MYRDDTFPCSKCFFQQRQAVTAQRFINVYRDIHKIDIHGFFL
jgi:hypothetical protein